MRAMRSRPEMLAFWRGAGWDDDQIAHASARGWAGFRRIVTPLPLGYTRIKDGDTLVIGGQGLAHRRRIGP